MKRDWEVVRKILIAAEEHNSEVGIRSLPDVENDAFIYHFKILLDGGFVHGGIGRYVDRTEAASLLRLTWIGHELLDKMRDETIWKKIKTAAEEKSLAMSFEVIGLVAKQIAKKKLGIDLS